MKTHTFAQTLQRCSLWWAQTLLQPMQDPTLRSAACAWMASSHRAMSILPVERRCSPVGLVPVPVPEIGSSSEVKVSAAQVRIHAGGNHDEDSFLSTTLKAVVEDEHNINRTIASGRADHARVTVQSYYRVSRNASAEASAALQCFKQVSMLLFHQNQRATGRGQYGLVALQNFKALSLRSTNFEGILCDSLRFWDRVL